MRTRTKPDAGDAAKVDARPLTPDDDQAIVRMYGQGLGDCFLLAFPRTGYGDHARPVWVVIDCGVIPGTPGGPDRMRQVVRDLRASTIWPDDQPDADDGSPRGHIDLLILTHEHMDHVSSFLDSEAAADWNRITVDRVWTAWTEKPGSGLSDNLKMLRETQRNALLAAAGRARRFGLAETETSMRDLLAFEGNVTSADGSFSFSERADQAFERATRLCPEEALSFCEPGEVRPIPGSAALAYVLGPPRDQRFLAKPDPTPSRPETYESLSHEGGSTPSGDSTKPEPSFTFGASLDWSLGAPSPVNAFAMPLVRDTPAGLRPAAPSGESGASDDYVSPFDPYLRIPLDAAESGTSGYAALSSYYADVNHWRRIDYEWLESSTELAVQLGDLTNNSSLVIAFELPADIASERKVLLFVGDAMVGNWLSWDTIEQWTPVDGARVPNRTPDIDALLRRTVLYKVGHHGSHNATLKARGVERMPEGGSLTAFVPVNPIVARSLKHWCDMPLDPLLDALWERTGGRVVLASGDIWPGKTFARGRAGGQRDAGRDDLEWAEETLPPMMRERDGKTTEIHPANPLWVQTTISF